jgi:Asp-tRNA(Asn)/Glu-tRNA(Gln) amidotransferase A subunit family amidase
MILTYPSARIRIRAVLTAFFVLAHPVTAQFEVTEATIAELQEAMDTGRTTSAELTAAYLARIAAYDQEGPRLNAMIRINPSAIAHAEALDAERASQGRRGPLHGIPIILKDNYDTFDMPTTAGTLALAGMVPPDDASQVRLLREAGVVILGKANMHELASGITTVASLGGQTLNPYNLGRNPGGSSGGTGAAIAASFGAIGWGSDTCGSIRIPSAHNNLVGLRPTKGLSSIDGIIPLSHTQDVGGPLARSVHDLAIALDATIGPDPADLATQILDGRTLPRFADALSTDALDGARIGILASHFGNGGEEAAVASVVRTAIGQMIELGADTLTVDIPDYQTLIAGSGLIGYEFKWDLLDYLAGVPGAPVGSLGQIIGLGLLHEALLPGMRRRNEVETRDTEEYQEAIAKRGPLREAVVTLMNELGLDALAYPTIRTVASAVGEPQRGSNCQLSAHTGLPALSIPAGMSRGMPVGIELMGRPLEDDRLLALGYAFEQGTDHRRAPTSTPPLIGGISPAPLSAEVRTAGVRGSVTGQFSYNPITGTLDYQVDVEGIPAIGVFAVVLAHQDNERQWYVAHRFTGPEVVAGQGTVTLSAAMRTRLEAGELYLELVSEGQPLQVARAPIVLNP